MGTYNCSVEDIIDEFDDFLRSQKGDISAEVVAKAWNKLAKEFNWSDRLKAKHLKGK